MLNKSIIGPHAIAAGPASTVDWSEDQHFNVIFAEITFQKKIENSLPRGL